MPFACPGSFGGAVRSDVGNVTQTDKSFTGQKSLANTGLMDYNARMYSPELGRFTQADTIRENLSNSVKANPYSYAENKPINATDPTGHLACWDDNRFSEHCIGNTENIHGVVAKTPENTITDPKPRKSNTLPVGVVPQPPRSTSCGESVFTGCWNYMHPNSPLDVQSVIDLATQEGYYTPYTQPFTSPDGLKNLAIYYYNIYGSTGPIGNGIISGNVPIDPVSKTIVKDYLVNLINNGYPVIIDASTLIGQPGATEQGNDSHFVIVTGYDNYGNKIT
jgi:RHS repeat-associated protein